MNGGLSKSLLVNTLWSFTGRIGYLAVALISNIILVRLLSPKEFGQVAIVMFFIALGTVLVESGLSGALIRKQNVTEIDYSTVFIFNLVISIFLIILLFISSGFIALFYGDSQLKFILIVASSTILINAFRITQNTKLIRGMDFRKKAFCEFISVIIGSIIAICLAIRGAGVWALVASQLVASIVLTITFWITVEPIRNFNFSINSFKSLYKFGVNTTLASLLNTTFDNIYQIILGKYFSLSQAGCFYQAKRLQDIPANIIETVMASSVYSALSKVQNHPEYFNNIYYNTIRFFTILAGLIFAFIFYYADIIVNILYGEKWIESILYLKLLVVASFFYLQEIFNRTIFKIFNKTEKILQLEVVKKIMQSITICYGLYELSIEILLYGLIITNISSFIINYFFARKVQNNFSVKDFLNIFKIIASSILVVIFYDYIYGIFYINKIYFAPLFLISYVIILCMFNVVEIRKDCKKIFYLIKRN